MWWVLVIVVSAWVTIDYISNVFGVSHLVAAAIFLPVCGLGTVWLLFHPRHADKIDAFLGASDDSRSRRGGESAPELVERLNRPGGGDDYIDPMTDPRFWEGFRLG
jgi:hypothetical protein